VAPSDLLAGWPGASRGAVIVKRDTEDDFELRPLGELDAPHGWASVTKVAVGLAVLLAVDEGLMALHDELGPPGATVRHLLSHASGLGPDRAVALSAPERKRIYSNAGFDLLGEHLARRSGVPLDEYVRQEVLDPLGMERTTLAGSAAAGMVGPLRDLVSLLIEIMEPSLLSVELAAEMRTIQYPALAGVLPGFGRFDPCPWGLGLEVKGTKEPHWTGRLWDPSSVGHFGQAGGFLVTTGSRDLGVVSLGDAPFGPWAATAWPAFLDEAAREAAASR
jgi:CubicO group peptidase (beta-lactamase class C family)